MMSDGCYRSYLREFIWRVYWRVSIWMVRGSYYTVDRRTMEYRWDTLQRDRCSVGGLMGYFQWDRCSVEGYLMGYFAVLRLKNGRHWVHLLFALYPRFENMAEKEYGTNWWEDCEDG